MAPTKATEKRILLLTGLIALVSLIVIPLQAQNQTREQVRTEAESALQRMTPAEIEQKLKELGISREEAAAKAKEYGISLDEYLSRLRVVAPEEPAEAFSGRGDKLVPGDPRLSSRKTNVLFLGDLDSLSALGKDRGRRIRVPVPGFKVRYGLDSLIQPFGYEIFQYPATYFTPSASAAPPPSYALGPGDELVVSLWGETRLSYQGAVNKEGSLVIPDVGPVSASGLTLGQFQEKLHKRMSSIYSSLQGGSRARTFLDVSLAKLKNIQVFVVGEVKRPGGYSIPAMSTILTAMYAAGGPTIDGGLRNIQIVRKGEKLPPADLYGYVYQMDKKVDQLLMDGDVVFVQPATRRVAIDGQVIRPAIYELKEGETLGNLIAMAGGLRFYASTRRVFLERIVPFSQRSLYKKDLLHFNIEFNAAEDLFGSKHELENGDVVLIYGIDGLPNNRVDIAGPVFKPGRYALTPGMRVADLIRAADSVRASAFIERGTVSRLRENQRRQLFPFNLRKALEGDAAENLLLVNEDSVYVYPDSNFFPQRMVTVSGAVQYPGRYYRREEMKVSDLIVMAGGLTERGTVTGIEVGRMDTVEVGRYTTVQRVDLPHEYWKSSPNDLLLADYDIVSIPENPKFTAPKWVKLSGYIMSPGTYTIRFAGERIADVFKRAGGLRVGAYLEGSRLFRKFNNAGLVPIDFKKALGDESSQDNVIMYDGDSIHVALTEDVVYVSGEVFVPSPVLYKKGASMEYYVDQAGGAKEEADEARTVVLLPGGKKWEGGGLFGGDDILPGSSVFVPKKIEKEDRTLPILRDLATILASLAALTVAMIQVTK